MYKTIISTETLAQNLGSPDWVIVDCRFDLKNPGWGEQSYLEEHVPGAVYAHLDRDLSAPVTERTGRHPLPEVEVIAKRLALLGINNNSQVVVYDTLGGAYAVRLWWQLRFLGHQAVAVLDGGFPKWKNEGRPLEREKHSNAPSQFIPHPEWSMIISADEVEKIRQDDSYRLIDARAPERYRGEQEPIDSVAGHIPGALNRFHGANLTSNGTFLSPDVLREQFLDILNGAPPEQSVLYCGSGVTSCHHILAMEIAGLPGAKLYPGSWSEWIRGGKRPISN